MKLSDIFKFKLFEGGDKANLKIVNENFEIAEKELNATNEKVQENADAIGNKVDKSKIANNLITTEEGYTLDARQGKVLGDKMTQLQNANYELALQNIQLTDYSQDNPLIIPSDGICTVMVRAGGIGKLFVDGKEIITYFFNVSDEWGRSSVFVKRGCKVYGIINGSGYVSYSPMLSK